METLNSCNACPRECGANRLNITGVCRANGINVSLMTNHKFEEPCISADKGSGAIFFSGCALRCVFCQNKDISGKSGEILSEDEFISRALNLSETADNLNFITPSHLYPYLFPSLKKLRTLTNIPFIFNTSGYDSINQIESLRGIADVFLPDFKYSSPELAARLSGVSDYVQKATAAIKKMLNVAGELKFEGKKIVKGVIVRHLVLPGYKENTLNALEIIARGFKGSLLSLMSQYCPDFYNGDDKNLKRRLTTYEYNLALLRAKELALEGYMQLRESASREFTPNFS